MSDGGETTHDAPDDRAAPIDNGMDRWPIVDLPSLGNWKPLSAELAKLIRHLRPGRPR
jgi:hypothetical protein